MQSELIRVGKSHEETLQHPAWGFSKLKSYKKLEKIIAEPYKKTSKDLKKIMRGTSHGCVSASGITKEEKNEQGQMERIGFLHRFKTRKGCEGEDCELTKKFKKEYCPELPG